MSFVPCRVEPNPANTMCIGIFYSRFCQNCKKNLRMNANSSPPQVDLNWLLLIFRLIIGMSDIAFKICWLAKIFLRVFS